MKAKVEERIGPGCVLAFDTNALWHHRKLFDLCDLANELQWDPPLQLVVPAVAHGEHVLHIRHETFARGRSFDDSILRRGLSRKGLRVETFGSEDAEHVAELIARRHPDAEAWRSAKRELAVRRLGLSTAQAAEARGLKFAATVDWLIAGQATGKEWILVTDDQGPEFADVPLRIDFDSLESLLRDILAGRRAVTRK